MDEEKSVNPQGEWAGCLQWVVTTCRHHGWAHQQDRGLAEITRNNNHDASTPKNKVYVRNRQSTPKASDWTTDYHYNEIEASNE